MKPPSRQAAPGPRVGRLIRDLPRIAREPHRWLLDLRNEYGDVVRLPFGARSSAYLISHPRDIHRILTHRWKNYPKAPLFRRLSQLGFGRGLVNSEGDLWQTQRRTLQPFFHGAELERFGQALESETARTIDRWNQAGDLRCPLDLESEMLDLLMRITSRALFGRGLGDLVRPARQAFLAAARDSLWAGRLPTPAWIKVRRTHAQLRARMHEVLADVAAATTQPAPMLHALRHTREPRSGLPMSEDQLLDEMVTLLFTGVETSALTLTWLWYLMERHPEEQTRARRELENRVGHAPPTWNGAEGLDFLEAMIHEALRLYPPSWANGRQAKAADELGGYYIPAGSRVILSQYVVHRHPDYWPDPESFRPSRFLHQGRFRLEPFSYFPFGAGPRHCLGQELAEVEIRLTMAILLPRFRLRFVSSDPVPIDPMVTLRPRRPIKVVPEAVS
ncbi:MAG TPA: cytochrome P450 [Anaerolineales bacterium]